ncbi:MAG: hypothetical protein ACRDRK_26140, partial [Pseudonocardia sp.]
VELDPVAHAAIHTGRLLHDLEAAMTRWQDIGCPTATRLGITASPTRTTVWTDTPTLSVLDSPPP